MMYYLTYDGEGRMPLSENLAVAADAFFEAVDANDWCPGLEDEDGVVLAQWANDLDFGYWTVLIGPMEDPNPEPGIDRIREEWNYKFGGM